MTSSYRAFVGSYYRWMCRMSPGGWGEHSPPESLALLQAVNVFSLLFWFMPLPEWLTLGVPVLAGLCFFFINRTIVSGADLQPVFPGWSAKVPAFREFPGVYLYLLSTLLLFVGSALGARHVAS